MLVCVLINKCGQLCKFGELIVKMHTKNHLFCENEMHSQDGFVRSSQWVYITTFLNEHAFLHRNVYTYLRFSNIQRSSENINAFELFSHKFKNAWTKIIAYPFLTPKRERSQFIRNFFNLYTSINKRHSNFENFFSLFQLIYFLNNNNKDLLNSK